LFAHDVCHDNLACCETMLSTDKQVYLADRSKYSDVKAIAQFEEID
jgi:hypothetical protein